MSDELERAAEVVTESSRTVILTGAGVSAESGVPTFRGETGLWRSYRPEELATPGAFSRDPRLVWEWYQWRRDLISRCEPNAGHEAIAHLQRTHPVTTLVTQNVDGLHGKAARSVGAEGPIWEIHGSIQRNRCTRCDYSEDPAPPVDPTSRETLPCCPLCDALLRPGVVWFGEALEDEVLAASFEAARMATLCLVVGTSGVVHPAASIPMVTAESGGTVIEVNPEPTPLSQLAEITIRATSAAVLPALLLGRTPP